MKVDAAEPPGNDSGQWSSVIGRTLIGIGVLGLTLTLAFVMLAGLLGNRRAR